MSILRIEDLRKRRGTKEVLRGISFELDEGDACAVIGPSGCGKTTLLRCINLLTRPDHGLIEFDGHLVAHADAATGMLQVQYNPQNLRQQIGLVFQEWNLWPNMTVRENVALALRHVKRLDSTEAERRVAAACETVSLLDKLDAYPQTLSGGQKQRAGIARALAMDPRILMLDEVTSALDPVLAAEVLDVMTTLRESGRTLVIVTHHIAFARAVANKVIFIVDGEIRERGPAQILDQPRGSELQWFLQQVRRGA